MGVKIGKHVEERIFLETENGCGICGIKDSRVLTIHHIEHELAEIDNSYDNLMVLCHNCHTMYHDKKGPSKSDIIRIKRRLIQKTLTPFGVNALKIAHRKSLVIGVPFTLLHLVELGLLKQESVMSYVGNNQGLEIETSVCYEITKKGKIFYKKWVS